MSSQKGNAEKKGAPAHQNKYAFKHNKGSKLTEKILAIPNEGVCNRCAEIIEWKKKYRIYKPLTTPAKWYGATSYISDQNFQLALIAKKRKLHVLTICCAHHAPIPLSCVPSAGIKIMK